MSTSLVLHAELGMILFLIGTTMNITNFSLLFGDRPNVLLSDNLSNVEAGSTNV